jgi:four helix bundle protein
MPRDPDKLEVFHRSHRLALDLYRLTEGLPASERYGLSAQIRRAIVSVPTNIVEGCLRRSTRDYVRFLDIALGSAAEVRYLLALAVDLNLLNADSAADCRECSDHVVREMQNLLKAARQFPPK